MGVNTAVVTVTGLPRGGVANIPLPWVPMTRVLSDQRLASEFTMAAFSICEEGSAEVLTSLSHSVEGPAILVVLKRPMVVPT